MHVAKRLVLEIAGWVLLVAGIAAVFLPGPGLLMMVGGLVLLSQQYAWADRWLGPLRLRALRGAAEGVATVPRIIASCIGVVVLVVVGIVWIVGPPAPSWWPFDESWWLPGGNATGISQIVSAGIGLSLLIYSIRRFYNKPEALAALEHRIDDADDELEQARQEFHERRHRADS